MIAVPGLLLLEGFVSAEEESALLDEVDRSPWLDDLSRRVQHYGWRYDYKRRDVDRSAFLGALPPWASALAARLHAPGLVPFLPDQVIVNEYAPDQGIASHTDCVPCFEDGIASLSLGSACVMTFSREEEAVPVVLERRSLVVLRGPARYEWRHGIARARRHRSGDREIVRSRRVSLTFRKVMVKPA